MKNKTATFYDDLAEHYHLIFNNWDHSIERQAGILGPILEERLGPAPLKVLDCACGIGTQTIGLARRGHIVTGSDVSESAIHRARRETALRGMKAEYYVEDMRNLSCLPDSGFDAVLIGDNSLPHLLSDEDLAAALNAVFGILRPGGILLATIRDYDSLLETRPTIQAPVFYSDNGRRRIVHQVWDWRTNEYVLHLYLTWETDSGWRSKHFASQYRALKREELSKSLKSSGFENVDWLMPEFTGFYQPIVFARKHMQA